MRVTRTTIAVLVLCFFTMQLKANEPLEASATVREGALQEALQLVMKDLKGESFIKLKLGLNLDLKLNPLPPLKAPAIVPEPNQVEDDRSEQNDLANQFPEKVKELSA
ncbi:MAG: hypothetical protein VX776_00470, partial [Planctomycetota bacterium]|nr:hypothetical protein [Planctomycetota bacterium]